MQITTYQKKEQNAASKKTTNTLLDIKTALRIKRKTAINSNFKHKRRRKKKPVDRKIFKKKLLLFVYGQLVRNQLSIGRFGRDEIFFAAGLIFATRSKFFRQRIQKDFFAQIRRQLLTYARFGASTGVRNGSGQMRRNGGVHRRSKRSGSLNRRRNRRSRRRRRRCWRRRIVGGDNRTGTAVAIKRRRRRNDVRTVGGTRRRRRSNQRRKRETVKTLIFPSRRQTLPAIMYLRFVFGHFVLKKISVKNYF